MWPVPVALKLRSTKAVAPRLRRELHTSLGKTVIPCLVVQVVMCTCNPSKYQEAEAGGLLKWGRFRLQNEFEASLNYITRFCLNPQTKTEQHWLLQRLSGQKSQTWSYVTRNSSQNHAAEPVWWAELSCAARPTHWSLHRPCRWARHCSMTSSAADSHTVLPSLWLDTNGSLGESGWSHAWWPNCQESPQSQIFGYFQLLK